MTTQLNPEDRKRFVRTLLQNSALRSGVGQGLRQHELADMVGVSVRTVARWCSESDASAPSDSDFAKVQVLAATLGMSAVDASVLAPVTSSGDDVPVEVSVEQLRELLARRPLGVQAMVTHEAESNLDSLRAAAVSSGGWGALLASAGLGAAGLGALAALVPLGLGPVGAVVAGAGAAKVMADHVRARSANAPAAAADLHRAVVREAERAAPNDRAALTDSASGSGNGPVGLRDANAEGELLEVLESLAEDLGVDTARLRRRLLPVLFTMKARGIDLDGLIRVTERLVVRKPDNVP